MTEYLCPGGHEGKGVRTSPLLVDVPQLDGKPTIRKTVYVTELVNLNAEANWRPGREGRCTYCGAALQAIVGAI